MSNFQDINLKQVVPALGVGIVVGAGGVYLMSRLRSKDSETNRQLKVVVASVAELKREWRDFKATLELEQQREREERAQRRNRSPWRRGRNSRSAATTSGSEDEFEEAYEDLNNPEYLMYTTPPDPLLYKDPVGAEAEGEDPATKLIKEADELFVGSYDDMHTSLTLMEREAPKYPNNAQVLWRLAKAKVLVGEVVKSQGDEERQKELVYSAREDAQKAVELDDSDAEAHKYYSITQGIISDWVPLSEAMSIGKLFKFHLERALELKPNDAYISHLYGRFIFTLANMGWVQRKAVVTMYGLTEPVSMDTALKWFLKAESLEPGFSNCNPFYMAECYIQKGETEKVAELLEKAITFQGNSVEEVELRDKARDMLENYQ